MEPKKEETKKKTTPKKTTSSVKSTATKKSSTTSKKNTTTKTSTSKTQAKKSTTPKATVSSTKKSTSTTKKSPSKTTTSKKSTPSTSAKKKSITSKQTPSKTKKSTTSKTAPVKVVPKKEIKTSLDKEIETPHEEPIKFITSVEKRKGNKTEKNTIDFQTINKKIKKVGSQLLQILKNVWLNLVTFFKNLKPKQKEEKAKSVSSSRTKQEKKVEHRLLQSLKQFSFKLGSFFKKLKPIKKEKEIKEKEVKIKEEKPSKVQTEKSKKKKGKWILFVIILFILIILMLIPYGKDVYLSGASNKNLEAPKFMKLKEECCSYTATFSSPRSVMALKKDMEKIIEEYKVLQCDNKTFYYNASENYTITGYSFKKGIVFNQLSITYGVGNSCDIDTKFKKLEVLPADFSIEDAKKDGNYVMDDGKIYNKEAYINFMDQINQKIESTLRIVTTNENKDVLITDVTYKDGKYTVSYDGTRDKNAKNNKSIVAYKFEHLIVSNGKLYAYNGDKLVTKKAKKYETYYLLDVE